MTLNRIIVQLQCRPGTAYRVADEIHEREIVSRFITSGEGFAVDHHRARWRRYRQMSMNIY